MNKMGEIPVSRDQLIGHLDEHLDFLRQSCKSFDDKFISEAKRLAVTVRVLLHDTKRSNSLLNQIGIKNTMEYYNTASPFEPNNLAVFHHGLVYVRIGSGEINFVAPLEESSEMPYKPNCYIPFSHWWEEIVIRDREGITYTRDDLVKLLANKDGGAHVDPRIDSDYLALKETNRMRYEHVRDENAVEIRTHIKDVELHSMRQIAFELIKSIEKIRPSI